MKKILIITLALIAAVNGANSQGAKSAYFELGGPGLASFNFDYYAALFSNSRQSEPYIISTSTIA